MMTGFDLFIGIDWSGAQGECHKGIQVAEAPMGTACPGLIPPPHPKGWSRADLIAYLKNHCLEGKRVLAGIDFAFSHPFDDEGAYYPQSDLTIQDAPSLWHLIDAKNHDQPHYYGGGLWQDADLRRYYNAPKRKDGSGGRGDLFQSRRRLTETKAAAQVRSPSPTFNCVGPAGVGTGSLAGMRVLHALKDDALIWPITHLSTRETNTEKGGAGKGKPEEGRLVLVEIFPAYYFAMAGVKDREKSTTPLAAVNKALAYFSTEPADQIAAHVPDHDDIDALISASALRALHHGDDIFPIDPSLHQTAMREGWIFGVTSPKTKS